MLLRGRPAALIQLLGFGRGNPFALALEHDLAFELSDRAKHVEDELAGRAGRVHQGHDAQRRLLALPLRYGRDVRAALAKTLADGEAIMAADGRLFITERGRQAYEVGVAGELGLMPDDAAALVCGGRNYTDRAPVGDARRITPRAWRRPSHRGWSERRRHDDRGMGEGPRRAVRRPRGALGRAWPESRRNPQSTDA